MLEREPLPLIGGAIRSVWALELLVLLRAEPDAEWGLETLVARLRASAPLVQQVMKLFQTCGLVVETDGVYRYAPASPGLQAQCQALQEAYRARPVAVINAIVASSSDDLRSFSDAFRMKGDKS